MANTTHVEVAKKLLVNANARIFDLECRLAEQENVADDLKNELSQLKRTAPQQKKQKRKHSALESEHESVTDDPFSDYNELSPGAHHSGLSERYHETRAKRPRHSSNIERSLRQQLAHSELQLSWQIEETNIAKRRLHLALTAPPATTSETSAGSPPQSPQYDSSATLSSERYTPFSPTGHGPRSMSPEFYPTSPPYGTQSPDYDAENGARSMTPWFSPTSPPYGTQSPEYDADNGSRSMSPEFFPTSPPYGVQSPEYDADNDSRSMTPEFSPTSPPYGSLSPDYDAENGARSPTPEFSPTSPPYGTQSPEYDAENGARSMTPEFSPTSPPYGSLSPDYDA
ncbi:uncharacterized protein RCC_04930 [Ramularia collo-cygni]|uniref:Uncharacterized protein n=1 Tax=Ramularia collo-cygni TaxID=112498 RepID=A0A2D3V906_9PEZI|nr:uncharacterized protein RCC_04930 [Ramularia collo-cygni]CZT19084.1 uncharacterized protein RCC_04930 [Ramularia collo-cygni]